MINIITYIIVFFDHIFLGDLKLNMVRIRIQFFADLAPTSPVHWFHFSHSFTVVNKIKTIVFDPKNSHNIIPLIVITQGGKNFAITQSFDLNRIKISNEKLICCILDYPNEVKAKFYQLLHCCNRRKM